MCLTSDVSVYVNIEVVSEVCLQGISFFKVRGILTSFKGLTLKVNVADPIVHAKFEVFYLIFEIAHLFVFFVDKPAYLFILKLYPSDLLDLQGNAIDVIDELLGIN